VNRPSCRAGVLENDAHVQVDQLKGSLFDGHKAVDASIFHPGVILPAEAPEDAGAEPDLLVKDGHGRHLPPWPGGSSVHPYAGTPAAGPAGGMVRPLRTPAALPVIE